MDGRYIKSNIFPIILEILFVPACLIFKGYHIYINFLFYMILAVYFCQRTDFNIEKWLSKHPNSMERVIFNVFKDEDKEYYEDLLL